MIPSSVKVKNKHLPKTPGVYLMKGERGELLYVGKAVNLRRRVESYFTKAHDSRIQKLVDLIRRIDYQETDTAIEALILEAELIKKYSPPFNVREQDDKSFLYVVITKEKFPRVLTVRGKDLKNAEYQNVYGPFTSAAQLRAAMRILRKIFPWNTHLTGEERGERRENRGNARRPCFDYEIHLCPGTCTGAISQKEYARTIKNIKLIFQGKKKRILHSLTKDMKMSAKHLDFEKAASLRHQIFALQHIQDIALIAQSEDLFSLPSIPFPLRIEGYDISNISGTSAVGSMVVFVDGKADTSEYRKFRIRTVEGPNDLAMMKEVLERRFENKWLLPRLVVVDGGAGQVRIAKTVIAERKLTIPVVGIAKGPERKRNDIIGIIPKGIAKKTLIRVRDEAHRFAVKYHKEVRKRNFIPQS